MINLLFMLLYAAAGFVLGTAILGPIPALRAHPRYLMAIGAAVMPVVWAIHALAGTHPASYGLDLLFLMMGVGAIVAGWEAEEHMEYERDKEKLRQLRVAWEHRSAQRDAELTAPTDASTGDEMPER